MNLIILLSEALKAQLGLFGDAAPAAPSRSTARAAKTQLRQAPRGEQAAFDFGAPAEAAAQPAAEVPPAPAEQKVEAPAPDHAARAQAHINAAFLASDQNHPQTLRAHNAARSAWEAHGRGEGSRDAAEAASLHAANMHAMETAADRARASRQVGLFDTPAAPVPAPKPQGTPFAQQVAARMAADPALQNAARHSDAQNMGIEAAAALERHATAAMLDNIGTNPQIAAEHNALMASDAQGAQNRKALVVQALGQAKAAVEQAVPVEAPPSFAQLVTARVAADPAFQNAVRNTPHTARAEADAAIKRHAPTVLGRNMEHAAGYQAMMAETAEGLAHRDDLARLAHAAVSEQATPPGVSNDIAQSEADSEPTSPSHEPIGRYKNIVPGMRSPTFGELEEVRALAREIAKKHGKTRVHIRSGKNSTSGTIETRGDLGEEGAREFHEELIRRGYENAFSSKADDDMSLAHKVKGARWRTSLIDGLIVKRIDGPARQAQPEADAMSPAQGAPAVPAAPAESATPAPRPEEAPEEAAPKKEPEPEHQAQDFHGDPSHKGKLHQEIRVDKSGHQSHRWVRAADVVQKTTTRSTGKPVYSVIPHEKPSAAAHGRLAAEAKAANGWHMTYPETGEGYHFRTQAAADGFANKHFQRAEGDVPVEQAPAAPAAQAPPAPAPAPAPEPEPEPEPAPKPVDAAAIAIRDETQRLAEEERLARGLAQKLALGMMDDPQVVAYAQANRLENFGMVFGPLFEDRILKAFDGDEDAYNPLVTWWWNRGGKAEIAKYYTPIHKALQANTPAPAPTGKPIPDATPTPTTPVAAADAKPPADRKAVREAYAPNLTDKGRREANAKAFDLINDAIAQGRNLTDAELKEVAKFSGDGGIGASLNQYFTRPDIAQSMWDVLRHHGAAVNGRVLEPACGSGVFIETAPEGAHVTGVEIDPRVALVAEALHGGRHQIHNQAFEEFSVANLDTGDDRGFDVVISNAPFGARTGGVTAVHKPHQGSADRYFIDTALDHAKEHGFVAMIVHTSVMQNQGPAGADFRRRLLERADLVHAVRLPNTAFKHAGTEVTSDILFLRKRPKDVARTIEAGGEQTARSLSAHDEHFVNGTYFDHHPEHVLGERGKDWRGSESVAGNADEAADRIRETGTSLPPHQPTTIDHVEAVAKEAPHVAQALDRARRTADEATPKMGDTQTIAGVTYILNGHPLRWHRLETYDGLKELQQSDDEGLKRAGELAAEMKRLRKALVDGDYLLAASLRRAIFPQVQSWVNDYGPPGNHAVLANLARVNPDLIHFTAAVQPTGAFADILTSTPVIAGGVPESATGDAGTVARYLAVDAAGDPVSIDEIREHYTGPLTDPEIKDALLESGDWLDASNGDEPAFIFADDYLTGDLYELRDKEKARLAKVTDSDDIQRLQARIGMIDKRIREDWRGLDEVEITPTAGWIPKEAVAAFAATEEGRNIFGLHYSKPEEGDPPPKITFVLQDGVYGFNVEYTEPAYTRAPWGGSMIRTGKHRVTRFFYEKANALKLMNQLALKGDDRAEAKAGFARFEEWCRSGPMRDEIEASYNRAFFGKVAKRYSTAPLHTAADGAAVKLHGYQNEAVRWAMERGSGILGLDVGLGKTFTAVALAREMKAMGRARKPVAVVPKSVAMNWLAEVERLQPGARVLVIGESPGPMKRNGKRAKSTSDDADTVARKMADAVANDYDMIIVTRQAFQRMPVRAETLARHTRRDFLTSRADAISKGTGSEKKTAKLQAQYDKERAKRTIDVEKSAVHFEDLGCDMLLIDEAHGYKNLMRMHGREAPKYIGASSSEATQRADDLAIKSRVVRERRLPGESAEEHSKRIGEDHDSTKEAGDGIFLLTATPMPNSPLDLYSLLEICAPGEMRRRGIQNAREFVDRYCVVQEGHLHLNTKGELVNEDAVTSFKNLHELRPILEMASLIKTAADVGLKIPATTEQTHMVEMNEVQQALYAQIRDEAQQAAKSKDESKKGAVLKRMSDLGKITMDPTLYFDDDGDHWRDSPKYKACVSNVVAGAKKGGQLVFVDSNESHERLATLMAEQGIPRARIATVSADTYKTADSRLQLARDFNGYTDETGQYIAPKYDVLIGNTGIMGEGMNLQTRTTDIHHLDIPWNPGILRQRNGRGVRQGNQHDNVNVHTYLAARSFDGFRLATVKGKKSWADSMQAGEKTAICDEADNESVGSDADVMIALSANPDEARKQYQADFASREAEKLGEARGRAAKTFSSYQTKHARLATLKPGEARDRLEADVYSMRLGLERNPNLPDKIRQALDKPTAIALHPRTFDIIEPGMALIPKRVAGRGADEDRAVHHGQIVTRVEPGEDGPKIYVRSYGYRNTEDRELGKLAEHVVERNIPDEVEYHVAKTVGTTPSPHGPYGDYERIQGGVGDIGDEHARALSKMVASHYAKGSWNGKVTAPHPFETPDGNIVAMPMHEGIEAGHRPVVPFGSDRKKLQAALSLEQAGGGDDQPLRKMLTRKAGSVEGPGLTKITRDRMGL